MNRCLIRDIHTLVTMVEGEPDRGGAQILGQPEIGRIQPGTAADMAMFRLDRIDYAGAMTDPASSFAALARAQN